MKLLSDIEEGFLPFQVVGLVAAFETTFFLVLGEAALYGGIQPVPRWRYGPLEFWSLTAVMSLFAIVGFVLAFLPIKHPCADKPSFRRCVAVAIGWLVVSGLEYGFFFFTGSIP